MVSAIEMFPYVYFTLKQRGNARLHVVSTWNTRGVFVGFTVFIFALPFPICYCLFRKLRSMP